MIIYSLTGKKKKIITRKYIRDKGNIICWGKEYKFNNDIVLRLSFNNIDKHRKYIENIFEHIKKMHLSINMVYAMIVEKTVVLEKHIQLRQKNL